MGFFIVFGFIHSQVFPSAVSRWLWWIKTVSPDCNVNNSIGRGGKRRWLVELWLASDFNLVCSSLESNSCSCLQLTIKLEAEGSRDFRELSRYIWRGTISPHQHKDYNTKSIQICPFNTLLATIDDSNIRVNVFRSTETSTIQNPPNSAARYYLTRPTTPTNDRTSHHHQHIPINHTKAYQNPLTTCLNGS